MQSGHSRATTLSKRALLRDAAPAMSERQTTPLRLVLVLLGLTGLVGAGLWVAQRDSRETAALEPVDGASVEEVASDGTDSGATDDAASEGSDGAVQEIASDITGAGTNGQAEATRDGAGEVAQDDAPPRPPERLPGALPEYDPEFDVVRVEPDGSAVIAGYSEPQARIMILLDGADFETVEADAGGNFAALLDLGASEAPQVLSLEMMLPDGGRRPGVAEVILAPRPGPSAPPSEMAEAATGAEATQGTAATDGAAEALAEADAAALGAAGDTDDAALAAETG
ncbi:MAG: hypothetical protein AAF729_05000, partial [Pseudomonadota bacterium]